jgi:putative nucleotidyltransferase with HDIG domain
VVAVDDSVVTFAQSNGVGPPGRDLKHVPATQAGLVVRIAAAGVVIAMLIALALGVSLSRSRTAARLDTAALSDQAELSVGTSGRDLLFDESTIFVANRGLTGAERAVLNEDRVDLMHALSSATDSGDVPERVALARVRAADEQLRKQQLQAELRLGSARGPVALQRLTGAEHPFDHALDQLLTYNARDSAALRASAQAAQNSAQVDGLAVGVLSILAVSLLVAYVILLLTQYSARVRTDAALIEQRMRDVEEARLETLQRLALAGEYRDDDTMQHTARVGALAARIANNLGLPPETVEMIRLAAPMHDIGKLGVSDTILLKPGPLTPEERTAMQRHTVIGTSILASSRSPVLQLAQQIALSHHERWNATGYPHGLGSEAIPIAARIVAVADVYDALTHDRPYKQAWPDKQALAEIEQQAGKQFDPQVVAAFLIDHPTPHTMLNTEQRSGEGSRRVRQAA